MARPTPPKVYGWIASLALGFAGCALVLGPAPGALFACATDADCASLGLFCCEEFCQPGTCAASGTSGGTSTGGTSTGGSTSGGASTGGTTTGGSTTGGSTTGGTTTGGTTTGGGVGAVSTLAGNGSPLSTNGQGASASFDSPVGVAVDEAGVVYVADSANNLIRRIDSSGDVTTLAGDGFPGLRNRTGRSAEFNSPTGVAVDGAGAVFVADLSNNVIRKIDASGSVTTLAGDGNAGYLDGQRSSAEFSSPSGVAVDGSGNVYVADTGNGLVRKIDSNGAVTTVAASAGLSSPQGIAVDANGDLFIADTGNQRVLELRAGGTVTPLAGNESPGWVDGPGSQAEFNAPAAVAVDGAGNVYVADANNNRLRRIDANGNVTTVAGNGNAGWVDGPAGSTGPAEFDSPEGLALEAGGTLVVGDTANDRIRLFVP